MEPRSVPTVEVLIVSFNTRAVLRECLRSLLSHLPPRDDAAVTVAVLDNASTDGSADMVAAEFPDVRLIRSAENVGFARGNNRLSATSAADYVLLLNSDVVVQSDFISPLLRTLASDAGIGVVGPRLLDTAGGIQPSSQRFPGLRFEFARSLEGTKLAAALRPVFDCERISKEIVDQPPSDSGRPYDTEFLWATCWLLRRSDISTFGLFDEAFITYDEDLDFCRRLWERGERVVFVPSASIVHLGGRSSTSSRKAQLERRGRIRYYARHSGRLAAAAYVVITSTVGALKSINARLNRRARSDR
jgi:GT2 family glycosyltransferase